MLKESDQRSNGQRLLKQLRDEYKKASKITGDPQKNIPPARASLHEASRSGKSGSHSISS